ncbi:MAG: geranylgeranyl reductase family protein [Gemmataceae bacterium]
MIRPGMDMYDVCVVGAGPSGATCAYYLAEQGKRVLLLEKKKFPRDKLCGDAICTRAQTHLKRMGVLQEVLAENKGRWAAIGGFVSPSGISFIGNSARKEHGALVIAIKRIILDEKVARAAQRAGAELIEETPVQGAAFSTADECWTVYGKNGSTFRARALVAADGASSPLARSLGIVTTGPDAVCSRTYIRASSTAFDADGVVYYPPELLPGYCALFREAGDELNFCCYIIPGGSCQSADLNHIYARILATDPHIRAHLGDQPDMERMRGAPLRLGGISRSYADQLLIVGDAAGHIDPLTGEGIQYGMDAAALAARTLGEAFAVGDLSARFLKRYQQRWMKSFGWDFAWSRKLALFCGKYPLFLDACAEVTRRKGASFLVEWAEVMTGYRPKSAFLRPRLALPLLWEAGKQFRLRRQRAVVGVNG